MSQTSKPDVQSFNRRLAARLQMHNAKALNRLDGDCSTCHQIQNFGSKKQIVCMNKNIMRDMWERLG